MGDRPEAIEQADGPSRPPGPLDVLILAAWCGLIAGELEVAARVAQRSFDPENRLYQLTRHFVWLVPVIDVLLFLVLGALCALAARRWPRRAGWLGVRLNLIAAVLPALSLLGRGFHFAALLILAMGFAACLGPTLERLLAGPRRWLLWSSAAIVGAVAIQGGWIVGGDMLKRWREGARPLPSPDSPNVLLIVLDTVRADHLSVYGYARPTTPNLEVLARGGVRFDQARAAAPWTLASHATLFTGLWPHELGSRLMHPMRGDVPTLAEYLGSVGYATGGFVGNTFYCAYDSGLDRGFAHYEDYRLDWVSALRTVHLVELALQAGDSMTPALASLVARGPMMAGFEKAPRPFLLPGRKDARVVNREFLRWLERVRELRRPFLAFLNYPDAHAPYQAPPGSSYRFGKPPVTDADFLLLTTGWMHVDKSRLSRAARAMAMDAYDSCIASIDDRLGELFGELQRRGLLGRTIVIVTADHGEGFGEHDLFDHGESLYRPEIRVPLLIAVPPGLPAGRVVARVVSLRDVPSTIAGLIGLGREAPFPGRSLERFWRAKPSSGPWGGDGDDPVLSELAAPPTRATPTTGDRPPGEGR